MNHRRLLWIVLLLTLMLTASFATVAASQSRPAANIDLSWNVISASGGHASSSSYSMDATLGQPIVDRSTGATIRLSAGFWQTAITSYRVFLPIVLK
ncbi:MAG TPA: hypothetical protein VMP08_06860 [Anaerolineae bacterium]|nr:hypothetical protein [Anaerolineae bacterium]